jgi:hypothetical protein
MLFYKKVGTFRAHIISELYLEKFSNNNKIIFEINLFLIRQWRRKAYEE